MPILLVRGRFRARAVARRLQAASGGTHARGDAFQTGRQVTVTEHDDAARAVADAARAGQRLYFEGFHRVCVFSDNGPAARDGAFAAKALFEETYPDVKVYVDYEIPYFIVSAGNCLTKEEAIMLKGRVSATFPKAFLKQLKREKSPISNLLDQ